MPPGVGNALEPPVDAPPLALYQIHSHPHMLCNHSECISGGISRSTKFVLRSFRSRIFSRAKLKRGSVSKHVDIHHLRTILLKSSATLELTFNVMKVFLQKSAAPD